MKILKHIPALILFVVGAAYVFSLEYLDFVDFVTGNILLPLGGLLAVIFAGWVLSRDMMTSEIGEGFTMNIWRFLMRWFVPAFLGFVLFFGFFDKIQQQYNVQLPGFMTQLLGPNNELASVEDVDVQPPAEETETDAGAGSKTPS